MQDLLYNQILQAVQYIRQHTQHTPHYGIVLGTGLGNLTSQVHIQHAIPYAQIPHFPISTVESHQGQLLFGTLQSQPVVVMAGRFHYYEGYTMQQVTFPIRVLKFLGVQHLLLSNVSGSVNANMNPGDIVIVRDHINLQPENPLRGFNDERLGPRFPDMLHTYHQPTIQLALQAAATHQIPAHTGIYAALQGPNLETPAEYEFLHRIGADVVGMSTVPEVLVARHMNLPVNVFSIVANKSYPPAQIRETSLHDVISVGNMAEPRLTLLLKEILNHHPA
jgi:purine-nucleoside phosphorylase